MNPRSTSLDMNYMYSTGTCMFALSRPAYYLHDYMYIHVHVHVVMYMYVQLYIVDMQERKKTLLHHIVMTSCTLYHLYCTTGYAQTRGQVQ